jgi:hypothetical protein
MCREKLQTEIIRNVPDPILKFNAIKNRKKAEQQFGKHPTSDNLGNFRIFRARARRTLKKNRRTSWCNFVSKLNCYTPMNKVWNMVQKIKGKNNKTNVHHLKDGRDTLTSEQDISNKLGQTLSKNSSTQNYHPEFQKFKKQKEKTKLNFKSKYLEEYNCPFSLDEMRKSLDVDPTISITSFSNIFRNRHSKLF